MYFTRPNLGNDRPSTVHSPEQTNKKSATSDMLATALAADAIVASAFSAFSSYCGRCATPPLIMHVYIYAAVLKHQDFVLHNVDALDTASAGVSASAVERQRLRRQSNSAISTTQTHTAKFTLSFGHHLSCAKVTLKADEQSRVFFNEHRGRPSRGYTNFLPAYRKVSCSLEKKKKRKGEPERNGAYFFLTH